MITITLIILLKIEGDYLSADKRKWLAVAFFIDFVGASFLLSA
jgi:hypothetical protein